MLVENPDDAWMADELGDGILYKAESTGDYTYRGDDAAAYDDVFDVEAGEEDYAPLTDFLQFLDEADDETFAEELTERLDVDAFASYLAVQTLVDNFDDIDGPGNNSFLFFDEQTGLMTVVAWDQNLSFGVRNEDGEGAPRAAPPPQVPTSTPTRQLGRAPLVGGPRADPPVAVPRQTVRSRSTAPKGRTSKGTPRLATARAATSFRSGSSPTTRSRPCTPTG